MRSVISPYTDPFLNLAIETVLFKHKPEQQRLLFVYFNSPCVVIGRNQNPWSECKLNEQIPLLRRRSGGGAVVHSLGNANFCVQTSRSAFSRVKHLEMVCRAFPNLNLEINKRNDLVLNGYKVSGSSFKIEKNKAYHHGTLLLNADLAQLGSLLHPIEQVQGRVMQSGATDSVRSRVCNTLITKNEFVSGIFREFHSLYADLALSPTRAPNSEIPNLGISVPEGVEVAEINDEVLSEAEELQSWEWIFGKTPKFEIEWPSGHALEVKNGRIASGWEAMEGERLPNIHYVHS